MARDAAVRRGPPALWPELSRITRYQTETAAASSVAGDATDGDSAYGTATKIASSGGVSVAGASAQGTATKIASPSGVCAGGALARGVAAKIAATSGVCVAGSLARGAASLVFFPQAGFSTVGGLAYGTATHIGIRSGTSVAGAFAQGVAAKIAAPSGSSVAGALAHGSTSAFTTPTPIGFSSAGASTQGTAAKTAITSGVTVAGALTYGVASQLAPPVSVSGVCSAGASAHGMAAQGGDVVMDTQVLPLAQALKDCLCAWLSVNPNPPQHCCFRVGPEVAHDAGLHTDLCCEGIAYVSIGDLWPSVASFPEQDIVRQSNSNCYPPAWGVSLKAGIIRCAPTGDEDPPTCPEWLDAHTQTAHDAQALRKASCCIRSFVQSSPEFLGMSVVIDRQIQGSPLGGCVERYFTVSIQIPNIDCC
jgi:hypothetical protein